MMFKRILSALVLFSFLFHLADSGNSAFSADTMPACKGEGTAMKILMNGLSTLENVFPIRMGGYKLINLSGVDDYNSAGGNPICICKIPVVPYYRVGITISMWEAAHLIETVKHPWCSPTVGTQLSVAMNQQAVGTESRGETDNSQHAAAQVHVIVYPVWFIVGLFVDSVCFQYVKGFDYLYLTEVDPLWQNDMWATLLGPEATLVANPVAQMACAIDSAAATLVRPLDPLFWCMGAWGSTYPMSENITSAGYVQANAGLAARMVAKLHREFLFWGTIGPPTVSGWCQRYPMPMWMKMQYNLLMLHPIPDKLRKVIGYPGVLWTSLKNPPYIGDDFVFMLYNKRDCCFL